MTSRNLDFFECANFFKGLISFSYVVMDITYLEDEETVAETVTEALRCVGYNPFHERCAQALLDRVSCGVDPGACYLLDELNNVETNPDNVTGSQVALELMAQDSSARIVIGTGCSIDELPPEVQEAINHGKITYLRKPFRMAELAGMYD